MTSRGTHSPVHFLTQFLLLLLLLILPHGGTLNSKVTHGIKLSPLLCSIISLFPFYMKPSIQPHDFCILWIIKYITLTLTPPQRLVVYSAFNLRCPQAILNLPCSNIRPETHFSTPYSSHLSKWLFHSYIFFSDKNLTVIFEFLYLAYPITNLPSNLTYSIFNVYTVPTIACHLSVHCV